MKKEKMSIFIVPVSGVGLLYRLDKVLFLLCDNAKYANSGEK